MTAESGEIVQRLRAEHGFRFRTAEDGGEAPSIYTEAADKIERLREALERIRVEAHGHPYHVVGGIRRPVPPGQCRVCAAVDAALTGRDGLS